MRRPRVEPPLSTKRARTFLFWRREGQWRGLLRSSERSNLRPEADGVEAHTDGSNPSRSATIEVSDIAYECDFVEVELVSNGLSPRSSKRAVVKTNRVLLP